MTATGYRAAMLVARMAPFTSTIFAEMSALAVRTGAINLGQGFPDTDGPASLLADVAANVTDGVNQYPPGLGVASLRTAVAEHQKRFYGLDVDPDHVLITTGATEAIASAVLALCGPGDEVVTFQPYYDSYAATIALSGATLRAVPLRPPTFAFDPDELRAAFSPRTRVVLVNTPHNPTGSVLGREQLTYIGELAAEFDAVVVTDEVYEHMAYDGIEHVPMATLPGLADGLTRPHHASKISNRLDGLEDGGRVCSSVGPTPRRIRGRRTPVRRLRRDRRRRSGPATGCR